LRGKMEEGAKQWGGATRDWAAQKAEKLFLNEKTASQENARSGKHNDTAAKKEVQGR